MYIYYKIKTRDMEVTKKDFYESLESYFGEVQTSNTFFEFETGLRFSLNLMIEVGKTNPKMLVGSLKSLHHSFVTANCEQRRNVTSFDFYAEEQVLNDLRTYLIQLIHDKNSSELIQELSIKLILLIGNLRGSGEDFLVVYNLIREHKFEFNIDLELSQCKFVDDKSHGSSNAGESLKISYEGSRSAYVLKGGDCDLNLGSSLNMTFDSDYIYLHQSGKGLFKLGQSDSISTKLGSLYKSNTSFTDSSSYFMHFNGQLYHRCKNSDGKPFTLVNKETLQEITDDEAFNKRIEALKPKAKEECEEGKKEEDSKKAEVEEDVKEAEDAPKAEVPRLEWTKEDEDDETKKKER
jgi:hypothetical protein